MFSKYSHGKKFNVDDSKFEYISLSKFMEENPKTDSVKVLGMFTFTGKFGEGCAIIANGYKIRLPKHLLNDVKSILDHSEEIQAVNAGKCGFKFKVYTDKNGVVRNSGEFIDLV